MASSQSSTADAPVDDPIAAKVKAMLAQFDAESDDDEPSRVSKTIVADKTTTGYRGDDDLSSDNQDSDVPLPRGRLAGRMKAAEPSENDAPDPSSTTSTGGSSEDVQAPSTEAGLTQLLFTRKRVDTNQVVSQSSSPTNRSVTGADTHSPTSPVGDLEKSVNNLRNSDSSDGSDNEGTQTSHHLRTERHLALVAKNRAARKAREAIEEAARRQRDENKNRALQQTSDRLEEILVEDAGADGEDADASRLLSSQVKPTRKASKKALEAMNRETQRMTRNMQLAHAATTRKKYALNDLFRQFNFQQPDPDAEKREAHVNQSSSIQGSVSDETEHLTPPTSPASPIKETNPKPSKGPVGNAIQSFTDRAEMSKAGKECSEEAPPALDDILAVSTATENSRPLALAAQGLYTTTNSHKIEHAADDQLRKPKLPSQVVMQLNSLDSDSDLEIAPADPLRSKLEKARSQLPAKKRHDGSMIKLRALAHLTSPSNQTKRHHKPSVASGQMLANLQLQARQQAARERFERIEELRAKGVIIQTPEERERDQVVNEDMLERARQEVEELTKRERKEANEDGEVSDGLPDSDEESYAASNNETESEQGVDEENLDLSGSEEDMSDNEQEDTRAVAPLFDNEAEDDEAEEDEDSYESHLDDKTLNNTSAENAAQADQDEDIAGRRSRRAKAYRVLDDEDEENATGSALQSQLEGSRQHSPAIVNPFAKFENVGVVPAAPMGLSQAFAATMDDSQWDSDNADQPSLVIQESMPEPNLPVVDVSRATNGQTDTSLEISNTQPLLSLQDAHSQSLAFGEASQASEMPEPTQDAGITTGSPVVRRFASVPPSTVDTVVLADQISKNDQKARKGKLVRRQALIHLEDEAEAEHLGSNTPAATEHQSVTPDAFATLRKAEARRARSEAFDKNTSYAKGMIDEQAEESEDEYAGLGGASDDESDGELDEETRRMVDDGNVNVNENRLAAFHADRERQADEKAVEKLYRDINTGMLRRKRGAGVGFDDLSDSDEEIERRRRVKRAENARMRKALLADENVGKIAENPKKAAFLKAIEDRGDDLETGFLEETETLPNLLREESIQEVPDSQPERHDENAEAQVAPPRGLKRPLEEADPNARPPPAARRTKIAAGKKPATLAEIRESVSFLIEEPHRQAEVQIAATPSSDVEDEGDVPSRFADRRRALAVVDRISLRRIESNESATSQAAAQSRRAFFYSREQSSSSGHLASMTTATFQVPSLLRRSTTTLSTDTSVTSHSDVIYATERTAGSNGNNSNRGDQIVRRGGGTKKSSVAYYAREAERMQAVTKVEARRDQERKKLTKERRGLLRGLGRCAFD